MVHGEELSWYRQQHNDCDVFSANSFTVIVLYSHWLSGFRLLATEAECCVRTVSFQFLFIFLFIFNQAVCSG
jgi:hypothetical protein